MRYTLILKNSDLLHHPSESPQARYYGQTPVFGNVVGLMASDLSQHVADLRAALEQAERALADVEANGALL